ncbi:unnamed protein product, partial [marine sediment metagenome]
IWLEPFDKMAFKMLISYAIQVYKNMGDKKEVPEVALKVIEAAKAKAV